jgi:hypothetical protein
VEHINDKLDRIWEEVFMKSIIVNSIDKSDPNFLAKYAGKLADAACEEFRNRTK